MMDQDDPKQPRFSYQYLFRAALMNVVILSMLFIVGGSIRWVNGWVFSILSISYLVVNQFVLFKYNPGLLVKRGRMLQKETKPFDRAFIILAIPLTLIMYIVIALDHRFGWSSMPAWLNLVGVALFILACALVLWAMAVNQHFEFTVMIRADGSQRVVSEGPYRWVRHPGYLSGLIAHVSYSLILGSWPGYGPASISCALLIVRTVLEDRALRQELPGYKEYAATTKARLLPRVW